MPDLVEWLETAISELERAALAASYWPDDPECAGWPHPFQHSSWRRQFIDEREMSNGVITDEGVRRHSVAVIHAIGDSQMPVYLSRHIALNDPHAVLRRCAADRKILADWLEQSRNPFEGTTDDELHDRRMHPAYEYATTEGQRKVWDYSDVPPDGVGWERNSTARFPEAWERFDYHEESYWRRLRPDGVRERQRPEPPLYIRLLAGGYGYQEAADHG